MDKGQEIKKSKFKKIMKAVFVHNIGWKAFAVGFSILLWILSVGL